MSTSEMEVVFPDGFLWGTATASYQIEGAVYEDGRGESIWDRFSATPGKVVHGDTGAVACDHYHRYREDVALMQDLGVQAYRFSVAWPRIFPSGTGRPNAAGLDFYDRLVDELLEHEIEPFLTLYHWDLPQTLEDRGGWLNRDTAEAFVDYTEALSRRLGDRVRNWITQNEPWCVSWLGYGGGEHAPGRKDGAPGAIPAAHHVLLAHGKAVEVLRREAPSAAVGITLNLFPSYPERDTERDVAAAWHMDGVHNRWFLDPVFRAQYPSDMSDLIPWLPTGWEQDLVLIAAPTDFLGVNYYHPHRYGADEGGDPRYISREDAERTGMGWEVYPRGLHDLLLRITSDYGLKKIYITENGASYPDVREPDGSIHDEERERYLQEHFRAAHEAVQAGVPLGGYFVWSLMDNFEWAQGYSKRFGLIYVDFTTQERVLKDSAKWFRDFVRSHRGAPVR